MSESPMLITAIAPWFGSARGLADLVAAECGPHSAWWSVFCGSMPELLMKPPCAMETVNDLHGDVINLARVVKHATLGPMLYRRCRRWIAAAEMLHEAAARLKAQGTALAPAPDEPDLDRAELYMVSSWMGRNGVAGTQSYNQGYSRRFTKTGGHTAKRWCSAVDSIPAWRRRLRHVSVLNEDGFALLERIEDVAGVVVYCDPPFVEKGASYVFDFKPEDHKRLAELLLKRRSSRVILRYYDHPLIRELYEGWTFVDCSRAKALVNQDMRDQAVAVTAPELLIINGPSFTAPASAAKAGGLFTKETA